MKFRYIVLAALMLGAFSLPYPASAVPPADKNEGVGKEAEPPLGLIGVNLIKSSSVAGASAKDIVIIDRIFADTPAEKAGLHVADVVTAIDSAPVAALPYDQIIRLVKGQVGTAVTISVIREKNILSFTCTRVSKDTLPAEVRNVYGISPEELKSQLEALEKNGFGLESITNIRGTISTKNSAQEGILNYLHPRSRITAQGYLSLPAKGVWSGPQAEEQYEQFRKYAEPEDENTAAYHFILGTHLLAEKKYSDSISQLTAALKEYPALSSAVRLRALAQYKLGNLAQAQKDWKASFVLEMPPSQMSDQWLKTVVLKLRDRWQSTTGKDPALLRRMRKTEIVITVAVERDGRLSKVQIRQSCGDASMDQTAQSSCQEASPVEAPPATLPTPVNLQLEFKNK